MALPVDGGSLRRPLQHGAARREAGEGLVVITQGIQAVANLVEQARMRQAGFTRRGQGGPGRGQCLPGLAAAAQALHQAVGGLEPAGLPLQDAAEQGHGFFIAAQQSQRISHMEPDGVVTAGALFQV